MRCEHSPSHPSQALCAPAHPHPRAQPTPKLVLLGPRVSFQEKKSIKTSRECLQRGKEPRGTPQGRKYCQHTPAVSRTLTCPVPAVPALSPCPPGSPESAGSSGRSSQAFNAELPHLPRGCPWVQ